MPYVVAIPFPSQPSRWCSEDQAVYKKMLAMAARREMVSAVDPPPVQPGEVDFAAIKMPHRRNEHMVDHSDVVVAAWNGDTVGGTAHCVGYARRRRKRLVVLPPGRLVEYEDGWRLNEVEQSCYFIEPKETTQSLF